MTIALSTVLSTDTMDAGRQKLNTNDLALATALAATTLATVNVMTYGATGLGIVDEMTAINAAVTALVAAGGGTLHFPAGVYACASVLDLSATNGVRLEGVASEEATGGSRLKWTGTTGGIKAGSSRSLTLRHLRLEYSNAAFSGYLVNAQKLNPGGDTAYLTLDNCRLLSASGNTATALISLDGSHDVVLSKCLLSGSQVGVSGKLTQGITATGGYAIAVKIDACAFTGQVVSSLKNADEAWLVEATTFEPITSGAAGAYTHDTGFLSALTFLNCWFGDDNASVAGSWIKWGGTSPLVLIGNTLGANQLTTLVTIDANNCNGIIALGNKVSGNGGTSRGIDFGATAGHTGVTILGNGWTNISQAVVNVPTNAMYSTGAGVTIDGLTLSGSVSVPGALSAGSALIGLTLANLLTSDQATFEGSTTGWSSNSNATLTRSTTTVLAGVYSLAMTPVAASTEVSILTSLIANVAAGGQYTALVSIKSTNARNTTLEIDWYDGSGVSTGTRAFSGSVAVTSSGWTQLSCTGTAPALTTQARLVIRGLLPTSSSDIFYLDQISLAPGTSLTWLAPSALSIAISGSTITEQNTGTDLKLASKGTSTVRINADAGDATGGMAVGDGSGTPIFSAGAAAISVPSATIGQITGNMLTTDQATFEGSTTGWGQNTNAVLSRTSSIVLAGAFALQVTPSAGGSETSVITTNVAATAGVQYTALASIRSALTSKQASLEIDWFNVGGTSSGTRVTTNAVNVSNSGWTTFTISGIAPTTTTQLRLVIRGLVPASTSDIFYVDQVSVAPGINTTWLPPGSLSIVGNAITEQTSGLDLKLSSLGASAVRVNSDPGTGTGGLIVGDGAGNPILIANATGTGFNGAAAVAKQTVAAAATDLASVITLANSLRTIAINVGLAS